MYNKTNKCIITSLLQCNYTIITTVYIYYSVIKHLLQYFVALFFLKVSKGRDCFF